MDRNTKIVLGVLAGIVVLCLCVASLAVGGLLLFIPRTVVTGPERIEAVVEVMPQFDVPEGWRTDFSFQLGGFGVVGYRPETGNGHLLLARLPENVEMDIERLERDVREMAIGRGYTWMNREMTVVERKPVTINGRSAQMVIAEGVGSDGPWRQAMTAYEGSHGVTLVVYGMPVADWDQETVDRFFNSLR